jgi:hypothetical protein
MPNRTAAIAALRLRLGAEQRILAELQSLSPADVDPRQLETLIARLEQLQGDIHEICRAFDQRLRRRDGERGDGDT